MEEVTGELAQQAYLFDLLSADNLKDQDNEVSGLLVKGLTETSWKTYARNKVIQKIGEDTLENSRVRKGKQGLSLTGSEWKLSEDIRLQIHYQIEFPAVFGIPIRISLCQSSLRKNWTGIQSMSGGGTGNDGEETVYITSSGTVYHRNIECYHLRLTISETTLAAVDSARNGSGGKYYPCERCAFAVSGAGSVYIAKEGDRYHITQECASLKRSVRAVPISQASGRRGCKDCG